MPNTKIIIDSGAFSAWIKKKEIDIEEYISYCLCHADKAESIVNLDVIPGEYGLKGLPKAEIERSAQKGWENYQYMLKRGIPKEKLIHVFHQEEDFKWLELMVKEIPYIGLSPANDRSTPEKIRWLDRCMDYVIDDKGFPKVKFHGFAVTSLPMMFRYPWYSVDSASWVIYARYGMVLVPKKKLGNYIYNEQPYKIFMSSESPKMKLEGRHYNTLSNIEQEFVDQYLESIGLTSEETKTNHHARDISNLIYFLQVENSMPKWPWSYKKRGLSL